MPLKNLILEDSKELAKYSFVLDFYFAEFCKEYEIHWGYFENVWITHRFPLSWEFIGIFELCYIKRRKISKDLCGQWHLLTYKICDYFIGS